MGTTFLHGGSRHGSCEIIFLLWQASFTSAQHCLCWLWLMHRMKLICLSLKSPSRRSNLRLVLGRNIRVVMLSTACVMELGHFSWVRPGMTLMTMEIVSNFAVNLLMAIVNM